jgi:hypothetical protein
LPRPRHKPTPSPKERKNKETFQRLTLHRLQKLDQASQDIGLTFDPTPEGIVKFSQQMIENVGANRIDAARATVVKGYVDVICRVTESGLDAIKSIEEDSANLEKAVRAVTRNNTELGTRSGADTAP